MALLYIFYVMKKIETSIQSFQTFLPLKTRFMYPFSSALCEFKIVLEQFLIFGTNEV
jgi:hypothetical protein